MEDILLDRTRDGGVDAGRLDEHRLVDLTWRNQPQLALKFHELGDLLAIFPDFVQQRDGGRQPSFELILGLDADQVSALTPLTLRVAIRRLRVLVRDNVSRRDEAMLDRG